MNNLLQLKGQFEQKKNTSQFGLSNLPVGSKVSSDHIENLISQLEEILKYWEKDNIIGGALVSVHYKHVVAKSNRIKAIFSKGTKIKSNDSIRGAKFEYDENGTQKHVFTHYVSLDLIEHSLQLLKHSKDIVENKYNDIITYDDILELHKIKMKHDKISLSNFINTIIDAYYVERFDIDKDVDDIKERSMVTIYKTNSKTTDLLKKLGINMIEDKVLDETTVRLDPSELEILKQKAPYLIAMTTVDISKMTKDTFLDCKRDVLTIPDPTNEPTVGVIDTLFYEDVYFSKWVKFENMLHKDIETDIGDCEHGTAVTSLIVDGPAFNPDLEDNCGRFRVKHFGVATKGSFSSFSIIKSIREIVSKNKDIKVWNLSLGSELEISKNFMSPEAAELDRIQSENDVIFVVAGTNKPKGIKEKMRIGAPADSLNSIVVNAVDFNNNPVPYHRIGPVLSFFHKPDISYYGGDDSKKIKVCTPTGEGFVSGTSFAAPWITRKVAYLIYKMGFSREVAKALLIDSAAGWNRRDDMSYAVGYGVVPKKIEDVINCPNDEIRFIMTGISESFETYTYNIPVPIYNNKHPFYARSTLCYFPNCSRNQGVDYTDTEMDVHFGRVAENANGIAIKSINSNNQGNVGLNVIYEEYARKLYRKWDNIKHINDTIKSKPRARKKMGAGFWGLSIKTKERLKSTHDKGTPFGVVITLKEMNGVNRIDDFMKLCMVRGWIVNKIEVNNMVNVYNRAEEEVKFE